MKFSSPLQALFLPVLAFATLALTACGPLTITLGVPPNHNMLEGNLVEPGTGFSPDRVAIIDVSGTIYDSNKPGLFTTGENPVAFFQEKLRAAKNDAKVKAVILRLNTPGGTVTASDEMYREVLRFKQETHKPVVGLMMDVTASGGYYLACSSDQIVTYPTTITGSIGVIAELLNVKSALNRIGIETNDIVSGPNKDAGSPFATLTPEQRAIFQGLVDDFYHRFLTVVRTGRPNIPPDQFAQLTDGRVVTGEKAVTVGLADQVGDLHDAFELAQKMAGIKHADLIMYRRPLEWVNSPYAAQAPNLNAGMTQINFAQINLQSMAAESPMGFFYLWQP